MSFDDDTRLERRFNMRGLTLYFNTAHRLREIHAEVRVSVEQPRGEGRFIVISNKRQQKYTS